MESLWDEMLPAEVKELPDDLARLDGCCPIPRCWRRSRRRGRRAARGRGAADDRDGDVSCG